MNSVISKCCTRCGEPKLFGEYFPNKIARDGLQSHCKPCHKLYQAEYRAKHPDRNKASDAKWRSKDPERAMKLDAEKSKRWRENHPEEARVLATNQTGKRRSCGNRVLPFAEVDKMKQVYRKAKEFGMQVDHVVPLKHPLVSGLHVWHNLQLLHKVPNLQKLNRYWPDQP